MKSFYDYQFDKIDPERHKEIARLGGVASGISRRKKRDYQKHIEEMLFSSFQIDSDIKKELELYRKWKAHLRYLEKKKNNKHS